MQALIDFLLRNLRALWPIEAVDEWQRAILVRGGLIVRELEPGLRWRWPFLDRVVTWPASEVVLDLGTSTITTADGITAALSGNLSYQLVDMAKAWRRRAPRSTAMHPKPTPPSWTDIETELAANVAALGIEPGAVQPPLKVRLFDHMVAFCREYRRPPEASESARALGVAEPTIIKVRHQLFQEGKLLRTARKGIYVPRVVSAPG